MSNSAGLPISFREDDHTYWYGGRRVMSVTEAIGAAGFGDSRWYTEQSARRGSIIHKYLQYDDEGVLVESPKLDEMDEQGRTPRGFLAGWRKFISDWGFVAEFIEQGFFNSALGVAGMPDRVGTMKRFPGWQVIPDAKSGVKVKQSALQTAGYELLLPPKPTKRLAVHLDGKGGYKPDWHKSQLDKGVFRAALTVAQTQRLYKAED